MFVGVQDIPGNVAEENSLPGLAGLMQLSVSGSHSCCGCSAAPWRELRAEMLSSWGSAQLDSH